MGKASERFRAASGPRSWAPLAVGAILILVVAVPLVIRGAGGDPEPRPAPAPAEPWAADAPGSPEAVLTELLAQGWGMDEVALVKAREASSGDTGGFGGLCCAAIAQALEAPAKGSADDVLGEFWQARRPAERAGRSSPEDVRADHALAIVNMLTAEWALSRDGVGDEGLRAASAAVESVRVVVEARPSYLRPGGLEALAERASLLRTSLFARYGIKSRSDYSAVQDVIDQIERAARR